MIFKALLLIIFTTVLWSAVNCMIQDGKTVDSTNNTKNFQLANLTALEIRFKRKYMGEDIGYVKWEKLHQLKRNDMEELCERHALTFSKSLNPNIKAEAKASFQNRYVLMGYIEKDAVEIDTLTCAIKFLDRLGNELNRMTYFLTEGDEPNSAFRFSLLETTIVLTRFLTDIWSKDESKPSNSTTPATGNQEMTNATTAYKVDQKN